MCGREGDVWGEEDVCGREGDVCGGGGGGCVEGREMCGGEEGREMCGGEEGREMCVVGREMCGSLTPAVPPTHRISIHHTPSTRDTYVLILIL